MPRICLLGSLQVWIGHHVVPDSAWKTKHARWTLGVLACARGPVSSAQLGGLLWPDLPPARAEMYARKAVAHLRDALEPGCRGTDCQYITTGSKGYTLTRSADCWVDVDEFEGCLREVLPKDPWKQKDWEALLREGSASSFQDRALRVELPRLEAALSLYRGRSSCGARAGMRLLGWTGTTSGSCTCGGWRRFAEDTPSPSGRI